MDFHVNIYSWFEPKWLIQIRLLVLSTNHSLLLPHIRDEILIWSNTKFNVANISIIFIYLSWKKLSLVSVLYSVALYCYYVIWDSWWKLKLSSLGKWISIGWEIVFHFHNWYQNRTFMFPSFKKNVFWLVFLICGCFHFHKTK